MADVRICGLPPELHGMPCQPQELHFPFPLPLPYEDDEIGPAWLLLRASFRAKRWVGCTFDAICHVNDGGDLFFYDEVTGQMQVRTGPGVSSTIWGENGLRNGLPLLIQKGLIVQRGEFYFPTPALTRLSYEWKG